MGRILLILLIALGVALYFPTSRAAILERAAPFANPAYRWMTRQELRQIAADLEFHLEREGIIFMRSEEFSAWLDRRYPQPASRVDAWGTRYQAQVSGTSIRVISAGPDLEFQTEDDLVWDTAVEEA